MSAEILIAEDNPLNFELLKDVLAGAGHSVEWARDGEDALARLRAGGFELLLLDLHMPRKDGFEVLSEIRTDPALAGLRVVVVSADAMGDVAGEVRRAGADGYLAKPVDIGVLVREVERHLGGARAT